jgi:hypothetical protein
VYRFGILVLSLSLGEIVKDPSVPKKGLPEQFIDFINKCLLKDERERWTAAQLLGKYFGKYIVCRKTENKK